MVVASAPPAAAYSGPLPATSYLEYNFGRTLVDFGGLPAVKFNGAEIRVTGYTGTPAVLVMSVRFHEPNTLEAPGRTLVMGAFSSNPVGWTMSGVRAPGGYTSLTYTCDTPITSDGIYSFPYGIYFGCSEPDQHGNFDFDFTADGYYPTTDVLRSWRPTTS